MTTKEDSYFWLIPLQIKTLQKNLGLIACWSDHHSAFIAKIHAVFEHFFEISPGFLDGF
jgi:hypothetical protein